MQTKYRRAEDCKRIGALSGSTFNGVEPAVIDVLATPLMSLSQQQLFCGCKE
jgi:hypothetical protein